MSRSGKLLILFLQHEYQIIRQGPCSQEPFRKAVERFDRFEQRVLFVGSCFLQERPTFGIRNGASPPSPVLPDHDRIEMTRTLFQEFEARLDQLKQSLGGEIIEMLRINIAVAFP